MKTRKRCIGAQLHILYS